MKTKLNRPTRGPASRSVARRMAVQAPDRCLGCGGETRATSYGRWCDHCGGVVRASGFYVRLVAQAKDPGFEGAGPDGKVQILKDSSLGDYTVGWWIESKTRIRNPISDGTNWTTKLTLRTHTFTTLDGLREAVLHAPDFPRMLKLEPGPSIEPEEAGILQIT